MEMNLEIIRSTVGDNYFFLIADDRGKATLIDPVDGALAVERVRQAGLELVSIINTHFHPDHVAGNPEVLQAFPEAVVIAGAVDSDAIEAQFSDGRGVDQRVVGGDSIEVGSISFDVLETPGHTPGHISVRWGKHLFSGDTIFVGGAGNCRYGGDPKALFETFRDVLHNLPGETIFYPGHDYSVRNAEFLLSIEPEHKETQAVLEEAKAALQEGRLMTTTLGREKLYNGFMRFGDSSVSEALQSGYRELLEQARSVSESEEEAVFRSLRSLRNEW